jgi:two-component SAPR family response regulator
VNGVSSQKVVAKTIASDARVLALKAELQQTIGEVQKSKAKVARYSTAKLVVESPVLSLSIEVKWDKVDSADLDAKVQRIHKVNRGTPEVPDWVIVHERATFEDNKRIWVDEENKQYDSTMVHDFTVMDGKETETRPFEMTKQLKVLKEIPQTDIENEFLIESQYEIFSDTMQGSLWKYAEHLKTAQCAAVTKIVLRKGYKDYNALIVPIMRPDGQFVMLAYLVRQRKKLKHWMPTKAEDSSGAKDENLNGQTVSVVEEI